MSLNFKDEIIWNLIFTGSDDILPSQKEEFLSSFSGMPDKGYGNIYIEKGKVDEAEAILRSIVDEFEWKYYPDGFITDGFYDFHFYYGKFDVEPAQMMSFFKKMIKQNIKIYQCGFHNDC